MSTYHLRLLTTTGLEKVLVKELTLLGIRNAEVLLGRNAVALQADLPTLWRVIFFSRVTE